MLPATHGTQLHRQPSTVCIRRASINAHTRKMHIQQAGKSPGQSLTRCQRRGRRYTSAPGGRPVRPWAWRRAAPAARPSRRGLRGLARPARHRCRRVLLGPRRELRQCRRPARRPCHVHTPVTNACGYGEMASPHAAVVQPVTSCRIVLAYASSGLYTTPCMHAQAMLQTEVANQCRERVRQRRSHASIPVAADPCEPDPDLTPRFRALAAPASIRTRVSMEAGPCLFRSLMAPRASAPRQAA
jgi:hypothetical protein